MSSPSFPFAPLSIEALSLDYLLESFLKQFSNHFEWVSFSFFFPMEPRTSNSFHGFVKGCKEKDDYPSLDIQLHQDYPSLDITFDQKVEKLNKEKQWSGLNQRIPNEWIET